MKLKMMAALPAMTLALTSLASNLYMIQLILHPFGHLLIGAAVTLTGTFMLVQDLARLPQKASLVEASGVVEFFRPIYDGAHADWGL